MVCLGNICRSPMAEGALRARLHAAGLATAVEVDSAGLGDWHAGRPPDARAIACAARHGVDIGGQRARRLRDADHHDFDLLLCADAQVLHAVRAAAPTDARARSALLLAWSGTGDAGDEVPDPYAGSTADFERAWSLVDAAAAAIVAMLQQRPGDA
ncbi:low molecular weight phosphotyrosine protein phosphatase [Luteimonas sp. 50]|uniref:protein-tyrosine-phosphatase n=1 Tax=Cognatiluteimonas sedimenti TaxID=2927791 RepID=A0ABT0A108_9GAMM|nr:low molecular weight protein-tyrosine-phosphatase [Lysobacter sedimenti]MCJ0824661.1 low molecular weight phosphotyrosine protein phosphatase [Lysobacter sedimenti]